MKNFRGVIALLTVVVLFSCDAPHVNPFDPDNPEYQYSTVDGFVLTSALPAQKMSSVKVTFRSQSLVTTTDVNGYYKFEDITRKNGFIVFEKDGYVKDSVEVKFDNQISKRLDDVSLNAIPVLNSFLFFTEARNKYPTDEPDVDIIAQVKVTDLEGDVDSVFIKCPQLSFSRQLKYNATEQCYVDTLSKTDLNIQSADIAVGQNFNIYVKDKKKGLFNVGSSNIKRIIKEEVLPMSPLNKQIVSSNPTLKWFRLLPGFGFKYTVQVYTDVFNYRLVWQKQKISKDDIQVVVDTTLPAGDYFWVIWCTDDYGNSGISKPVSFVVQ